MQDPIQVHDLPGTAEQRVTSDGMDHVFRGTVSDAMADKPQKKILELPIIQAAEVLGISERTLWRRIEDGQLKSRLKGNKRVVRVPLTDNSTVKDYANPNNDTATGRQVGTVIDLQPLLRELNAANYRIGYLESKLEEQDKQVKLLPDLQAKATQAAIQEQKITELQAELTALKASWWHRARWWLSGKR
jgi:hypothetical protein